jgi:hypothetical protein
MVAAGMPASGLHIHFVFIVRSWGLELTQRIAALVGSVVLFHAATRSAFAEGRIDRGANKRAGPAEMIPAGPVLQMGSILWILIFAMRFRATCGTAGWRTQWP